MTRRDSLRSLAIFATIFAGHALAQTPPPPAAPAKLSVAGAVSTPLSLSAEDLAAMPRAKASLPAPDGKNVEYEGVSLAEVLKRAGAPLGKLRGKALATYIVAKARDGYRVVFTLAELDPDFANEQILVADTRDGKPLPASQGPLRLVCPRDREGARSVRMLETIEVFRVPE